MQVTYLHDNRSKVWLQKIKKKVFLGKQHFAGTDTNLFQAIYQEKNFSQTQFMIKGPSDTVRHVLKASFLNGTFPGRYFSFILAISSTNTKKKKGHAFFVHQKKDW